MALRGSAVIHIEHLYKNYFVRGRSVSALRNIHLHIPKGKIFGIIGRSGAGKSTLIRTLNLLERPTQGSIHIDSEDITQLDGAGLNRLRRRVGMIFQNFNLLHAKTVAGNVDFPLKLAGSYTREQRNQRVNALLEMVGLSEHRNKYPAQLSGGQKQRVGIARAIAHTPQLLLCDEPTSALDPETTQSILELLSDINRKLGLTIVLITHEMKVIRTICDNVAVIDAGEIVESGEVTEVLLHPQHAVTRSLVAETTDAVFNPSGIQRRSSALRVRLTYVGETTYQPILSHIVARTKAQITIMHGTISRIKNTPYGQLLIELGSNGDDTAQVFDLFNHLNIRYEVLG